MGNTDTGVRQRRHLDPTSHIALGTIGILVGLALGVNTDLVAIAAFVTIASSALFGVGVVAQGIRIGLDR